jgi:hypothetical protein
VNIEDYSKEDVLGCLKDMVYQCCCEKDGVYNSGFISAHAEAIRTLVDCGFMTLVHDGGGRWVEATMDRGYSTIEGETVNDGIPKL